MFGHSSPSYPRNALHELRLRVPELHPYAALTLTLESMLLRGEIDSDEYLRLAAALVTARRKPLFTPN